MTSIEAPKPSQQNNRADMMKVLLPYGLAILIQVPMLMLYFRQLWNRPHYQPFAIAILATVGLAIYRWPFDAKYPFHKSIVADVLLVFGLGGALLGTIFVEPWFVAASAIFLVTSLLARTLDRESLTSLWPCSLPLFVYLMLPGGMDVRLITKLQQYSAGYTSRLLDLAGLGHHMDGTVIKIPGMKEYGIEQACSGIQSFFTLLLVATIFVVASRRIRIPKPGLAILSVLAAIVFFVIRANFLASPFSIDLSLIVVVGFALFGLIGFQSTALILSAVFWAVFMNTLRILLIPLADHFLEVDLSSGMSHDLLGYAVLTLGIILVLSTDQFLMFLFGPVDPDNVESGPFSGVITKFWNGVLSGTAADEEDAKELAIKRAMHRKPVTGTGQTFIWASAGLVVALGLYQFVEVQRSKAHPDLRVQFFSGDDLTVDFEREDMPETISDESDSTGGPWKLVNQPKNDGYDMVDRTHGSDLGQRSDVWQYRSRNVATVASFDQTFPGWHELTVCYKNQGWKLVNRQKIVPDDDEKWSYIEADLERSTGEKGFLLFSHFDAFGEGLDAPRDWGTINSFVIRARNRMDHRIRAQLFQSEAYQSQVFTTSFNELDEPNKGAIRSKYLKIRDNFKEKFLEKRKAGQNGGAPATSTPEEVEAE